MPMGELLLTRFPYTYRVLQLFTPQLSTTSSPKMAEYEKESVGESLCSAQVLIGVMFRSLPTCSPPTLSHAAFFAVDSLSRSCSGVILSTSHQRRPPAMGPPSVRKECCCGGGRCGRYGSSNTSV